MEPLFINRYVRDEAVYREVYQYNLFKRPLSLTLCVLMGLCFLANLVPLLMGEPAPDALFIAPVFFVLLYICYRRQTSLSVKRDLENCGHPPTVVYEVTEAGIRLLFETNPVSTVSFSQIRRVMETKHLILLQSEAKLLHIFHKDGFVVGSVPEFNKFLWDKKIRFR